MAEKEKAPTIAVAAKKKALPKGNGPMNGGPKMVPGCNVGGGNGSGMGY
jgi:hypothetical protein